MVVFLLRGYGGHGLGSFPLAWAVWVVSVRLQFPLSCVAGTSGSRSCSPGWLSLVWYHLGIRTVMLLCTFYVPVCAMGYMGGIGTCGVHRSLPRLQTVGKLRLVVVAVQGAPVPRHFVWEIPG